MKFVLTKAQTIYFAFRGQYLITGELSFFTSNLFTIVNSVYYLDGIWLVKFSLIIIISSCCKKTTV